MKRIYLDHAATSPLLPQAKKAMLKWLDCGNASSLYQEGRQAKAAIDEARERVSALLGCDFGEVVFTSGGSEAVNTALLGVARANVDPCKNTILIGVADHHCGIHCQEPLERLGYKVEFISVDQFGCANLDHLKHLLTEKVLVVSTLHANNELGTLQSASEIGSICHEVGALFHCDAVQTFGKSGYWTKVEDLRADLVSVSAHKLGGPKGAGALYVKAGTKPKQLIVGGGQEREMRAGTENVAAIAGFGVVAMASRTPNEPAEALRKLLTECGAVPTVPKNVPSLHTHIHIRFPGLVAETVLIKLDQVGISAGSGAACSSGSLEPSHVLRACGYSEAECKEGIRFTLGPETTLDEAIEAGRRIKVATAEMRERRTV